ncbi:MAG: OsmC family protein [Bacteroidia bacterium]|nr:OsmC family protein [Bacteroidia bacterium]
MKTARIIYNGDLRTTAEHIRSGKTIITDAPPDNHGKGEAFSPTDLVASAFVSCMMTVMGIVAHRDGMDMGQLSGEVEKVMADNPRRISALHVVLTFQGHSLSDKQRDILERTAIACPVARSLHPDIAINLRFEYQPSH